MKTIYYSIIALALLMGSGRAMAQTEPIIISDFPFSKEISQNGEYVFRFTLAEPAIIAIPKIVSSNGDLNVTASYRDDNNGYDVHIGQVSLDSASQVFPAGTHSLILFVAYGADQPFTVHINKREAETITVPHKSTMTMQSGESKLLKFTLSKEMHVWGQTRPEGYVPDGHGNSSMPINFYIMNPAGERLQIIGGMSSGEILPAGTYYALLGNFHGAVEELSFDLKIGALDMTTTPSYTDIDYSTVITLGTPVSGTFTDADLATQKYYDDYYEDTVEYISYLKGFTLNVTAGKQYTFGSDYHVVMLKNGTLTGLWETDVLADAYIPYIAEQTQTIRVLLEGDGEEGQAYTLTVTESNAPVADMPLSELLDNAKVLTYNSLPFSESTAVADASTVKISYMGVTWVAPAVAYKISIPAQNTGIGMRSKQEGSYIFLYQKTGGEYQIMGGADSYFAESTVPAGDYWALFAVSPDPEEAELATRFDVSFWNTAQEPGTTTLKALLDATTSAVQLPYNTTGNTSDGAVVPELEDNNPHLEFPSKVKAWKVNLTETSDLFVNSNMALGLCVSDGEGNYELYQNNFSNQGALLFYNMPAGDYYVVGAFDNVGRADLDFWLQISTSQEEMPKIVSITANVSSISVVEGASENEIRRKLEDLDLRIHLSNEQSVDLQYNPSWTIEAKDTDSAKATLESNYFGYEYAETYEPLVIKINYHSAGVSIAESKVAYQIYAQDHTIYVSGVECGDSYQLFNVNGSRMSSGTATSNTLSIPVPQQGIYIVRIGAWVAKVLVR